MANQVPIGVRTGWLPSLARNNRVASRICVSLALGDIDGLAFVKLTGRDVVRHRIVSDIVDAYERDSAAKGQA